MICCLLVALAGLTGLSMIRPMQAVRVSPANGICCRDARRHGLAVALVAAVVAVAGITSALAVHHIYRDAGHMPGPICLSLNRLAPTSNTNR